MKTKCSEWSDQSKPIIERVGLPEYMTFRINARVRFTEADELQLYELTNTVEHLRAIVNAYDAVVPVY